ncbi:helix-turn-helix transcriptional regulator [Nitratireductor aquimarinus]|uniref:S24 family peptidase n=1 Tax=Nitratireductor TaxID=245876 RepID=UPI000DDE40CB|nr:MULTISPECIES: helix-turn-helix transcriptional regulator [Nitratireductor]MBN7775659.1 helix-turn-helix transcriptional regulator [Nitratireductor pacificus]MBN7781876.1 helix-turn-helix transcriptional regulator [Nitratireductor pacificus]MBN7790682.1 helix-turn-helix transcriptional regulator [Nitratireductor aquimarinus]MBN8243139.1 helix-turn-helix transcriptional regulator [Nitratireductor aquimarinus]MBY6098406.1 helix-turn-helix transcriptional regulator [Nitratireductor aquimarinus]
MLSHDKVWAAIDALAARHSLSASGLARKAGLDSTAFNKSKRLSADGRPRWPSTESLSKIMLATGTTLSEFFALLQRDARPTEPYGNPPSSVPLIGFAQAGAGGFFDDAGFPLGEGWEQVDLPGAAREGAYALQVQGESMMPLYRDGDTLIVDPTARLRRGDRVVVKTAGGEVMAKVLLRQTSEQVELLSLNPEHPNRVIEKTQMEWMARIVWASQ